MKWLAMSPGVPPDAWLSEISPSDAVLPSMPISSPGAATQRTIPPNALNAGVRRYSVLERCGLVVDVLNCTGMDVRLADAGSSAAIVPPESDVAPVVES